MSPSRPTPILSHVEEESPWPEEEGLSRERLPISEADWQGVVGVVGEVGFMDLPEVLKVSDLALDAAVLLHQRQDDRRFPRVGRLRRRVRLGRPQRAFRQAARDPERRHREKHSPRREVSEGTLIASHLQKTIVTRRLSARKQMGAIPTLCHQKERPSRPILAQKPRYPTKEPSTERAPKASDPLTWDFFPKSHFGLAYPLRMRAFFAGYLDFCAQSALSCSVPEMCVGRLCSSTRAVAGTLPFGL